MGNASGAEGSAPPMLDTSIAHQARIYDYWLGGKDNFAVDREAGDRALELHPNIIHGVRANRAFLVRAVRYLTGEVGVRQFLDVGTGLPSANNTHEVAQGIAPDSRIVYVDNDPVVLLHARTLLTSKPEGACAYLDADARVPETILTGAARVLDLSRPVALMMLGVLQLIPDDQQPYRIVATLMDALPPGSYLTICHPAGDMNPGVKRAAALLDSLSAEKRAMRSRDEVLRFFDGLELVEPGLVPVAKWRPESQMAAAAPASRWAGVGRKAALLPH
jgi:S-adenosyl methyltransferase